MTYYDYMIVDADNIDTLTEQVDTCIGGGYQPLGGIAVVQECNGDLGFFQAVARVKDES